MFNLLLRIVVGWKGGVEKVRVEVVEKVRVVGLLGCAFGCVVIQF